MLKNIQNTTIKETTTEPSTLFKKELINFNFKNKEVLLDYLDNNTELYPILIKSESIIRKYFKNNDLVLEYYFDPEFSSLNCVLINIIISQNDDVALAMDDIHKIDIEMVDLYKNSKSHRIITNIDWA
ncbi:hypothetical protein [Methanobrevibacter sp. DSM 116169]|uniref:hypothetical protein n=1 Tax=Methanobrevibacter sp. DSM 116169 TaxID=3242727 RepID=UPI0038FCAAC2